MKKVFVFILLFSISSVAFAAVNINPLTAVIAAAKSALLLVLGALLSCSVAIYGLSKLQRFLDRKAKRDLHIKRYGNFVNVRRRG